MMWTSNGSAGYELQSQRYGRASVAAVVLLAPDELHRSSVMQFERTRYNLMGISLMGIMWQRHPCSTPAALMIRSPATLHLARHALLVTCYALLGV
jgi:hypothetical protein